MRPRVAAEACCNGAWRRYDDRGEHPLHLHQIGADDSTVIDGNHIETASPQFVRQLAAELIVARRRRHVPLAWVAHRSRGRFSRRELADVEAGRLALTPETVADLAGLYGLDLAAVLPGSRNELEIRADGLLSSGGMTATFTPGDGASLVTAYFQLTRRLRHLDDVTTMPLRRDDVRCITDFLEQSGAPSKYLEAVLAASIAERRVLAGSLIAGAVSIGLAGLTENSSPATAVIDRAT